MVMLTRIDPTRKMDRWYSVSVQATLLDPVVVCLAWGSRRTSYVRMRTIPVSSLDEAQALAERIVRRKMRRGYVVAGSTPWTPKTEKAGNIKRVHEPAQSNVRNQERDK